MEEQTLTLLHGSGPGDLQFSPDGALMVTSGQDSRICVVETASALENDTTEESLMSCDTSDSIITFKIFCQKEDNGYNILTANENRIVSVYSCATNNEVYVEQSTTLGKFPLAPLAVDVSAKDNTMAYSGGDSDIHLAYPGAEIETMAGCRPDVVGLCFDPKGEYLASASTDGNVRVFKVSSKTQVKSFEKQLQKNVQVNGETCSRWRPSWHPEGSLLALPGAQSIKLVKRGTWSTAAMLSTNGEHKSPVTMTCWSSTGAHVASCDSSGKVIVWDLKTRKEIKTCTFSAGLSSLQFCPSGNILAVLTTEGEYSLITDAVPTGKGYAVPSTSVLPPIGTYTKGVAKKQEAAAAVEKQPNLDEKVTGTSSSKAVLSVLKHKLPSKSSSKKTTKRVRIVAPGDAAKNDDNNEEEEEEELVLASFKSSKKKKSTKIMDDDDDDDDDDEDMLDGDLSALKAKFTKPIAPVVDVASVVSEEEAVTRTVIQQTPETPMQDVFQPGATYPREGTARRFLCWNLIGSITTREDQGYNAVEIEFSDSSAHRPVRFSDNYDFGVASLGPTGALFGSQGTKKTPSTLFYKPFESWAHNADWTLTLSPGDQVETVAVGNHWCAASTSSGHLRCFRDSGLQLSPILTPGQVVTMSASGSRLVVVYHSSAPLSPNQGGTQTLSFVLYDLEVDPSNPMSCVGLVPLEISRGTLPLAAASISTFDKGEENLLEWIGFDELQRLHAFDSCGRLLVLSPNDMKTWMVSLDTKRTTDDTIRLRSGEESHWIVGVSHGRVMSTVCKGREKVDRQPRTMPKPLLTALPLGSGVLLSNGNTKMTAEINFLQQATSYSQRRRHEFEEHNFLSGQPLVKEQSIVDRSIIQLIQSCLKQDNPTMALDLASRLHVEKSFAIVMKLARSMNQETLATKIYQLMQMRMEAILKVHETTPVFISAGAARTPASTASTASSLSITKGRMEENEDEEQEDAKDAPNAIKKRHSNALFVKNLKRKRTDAKAAASKNTECTSTPSNDQKDMTEPPSKKKTTRKPPVNPFLKKSMVSPQKSVGNAGDALSKLAGSPTPSKPVLGRQSSFTSRTMAKREKIGF